MGILKIGEQCILIEANAPYWLFIGDESNKPYIVKIESDLLLNAQEPIIKKGNELTIDNLEFTPDTEYIILRTEKQIIISENYDILRDIYKDLSKEQQRNYLEAIGSGFHYKFLSFSKNNLIKKLSGGTYEKNTTSRIDELHQVLLAFKEYTFFDQISAWFYNYKTDTFTRVCGDTGIKFEYISKTETDKQKEYFFLSQGLDSHEMIFFTLDKNTQSPDEVMEEINYANIFKVYTNNKNENEGIQCIICLYTKYPEYILRKDTYILFKGFIIQMLAKRYFEYSLRLSTLYEKIYKANTETDYNKIIKYDSRTITELDTNFYKLITRYICDELKWEASAIFLKQDDHLYLFAQYPVIKNENKKYSINQNFGLTPKVFQTGETQWSYDTNIDPLASNGVSDYMATKPRNWIGVPITENNNPIGVLRVRNKKKESKIDDSDFCNLDIIFLENITKVLSNIIHQRKNDISRIKNNEEMNDYIRTFRHEFRSPVEGILYTPKNIATALKEEYNISPENINKNLRTTLIDFSAIGSRLAMLTEALTLNPEDLVRDKSRNNIYKTVIAPVLKFSKPYAQNRNKTINEDKDSLMVRMTCDAKAMSIAFNALIDNAIKYSDKHQVILVYGKYSHKGFQIIVESSSDVFKLNSEDINKCSEKYYRSNIAKQQKMEGSGIGLFLANEIVRLHGGKLEILSHEKPIKFALLLPEEEEYAYFVN